MDIKSLIESGFTDFNVTLKFSDLVEFGNHLIARMKEDVVPDIEANSKEKFLTKQEVMEKFGVCHTTLWNWARTGVLVPIKVGRKVHYSQRDIQALLESR